MTPQEKKAAEKYVSEIRKAKQKGFITHMSALGKSAAEIKELHQKYVELDQRREAKYQGIRDSVLEGLQEDKK